MKLREQFLESDVSTHLVEQQRVATCFHDKKLIKIDEIVISAVKI